LLIKESPPAEQGAGPIDSLPDAERPQDPHAIRRQIDPCPDRRPRCAAFNELWSVALTVQGGRKGEARDASPNDQDPINLGHVVLLSCALSKCFVANKATEAQEVGRPACLAKWSSGRTPNL
jgi:hypothetical protein